MKTENYVSERKLFSILLPSGNFSQVPLLLVYLYNLPSCLGNKLQKIILLKYNEKFHFGLYFSATLPSVIKTQTGDFLVQDFEINSDCFESKMARCYQS